MAYFQGLLFLGSANFFQRRQVNILGFVGHIVFVTIAQLLLLCENNHKQYINESVCLCPNKLSLTKQMMGWIWPVAIVCQLMLCAVVVVHFTSTCVINPTIHCSYFVQSIIFQRDLSHKKTILQIHPCSFHFQCFLSLCVDPGFHLVSFSVCLMGFI